MRLAFLRARPRTAEIAVPFNGAQKLGAGLASEVYKIPADPLIPGDVEKARKVFVGHKLTNIINWVFTGAPRVPYNYDPAAIECSRLRRGILGAISEFEYGGKVSIASAFGVGFSEELRAYYLDTRFVEVRPLKLAGCFTPRSELVLLDNKLKMLSEMKDLFVRIGFSPWQVGYYNPKGLPNVQSDRNGSEVLIDCESGVPNLFPLGFKGLAFYIKRAIDLGAPFHDKVDTGRLAGYIIENRSGIISKLGIQKYLSLVAAAEKLERMQQEWVGRRRVDRDLLFNLKQGRISEQQFNYYSINWVHWYAKRAVCAAADAIAAAVHLPSKLLSFAWNLARAVGKSVALIFWPRYRREHVLKLLNEQIDCWEKRGVHTKEQSEMLRKQIKLDSLTHHLSGLAIELALNPLCKAIEIFVIPFLAIAGVIPAYYVPTAIVWLGSIVRTVYCVLDIGINAIANAFRKEKIELPFHALWFGAIVTFGNGAYLAQIALSRGKNGKIPEEIKRFIGIFITTMIGENVPIYGGEDTLLQHKANRLGYKLFTKK